jgi:hypothetical protein
MRGTPFWLSGSDAGGAACHRHFYPNRSGVATASPLRTGYAAPVQVRVTDELIEVRLTRIEKILGLMRSITLPLADISDVSVVDEPVREAMSSGIKVGLRLPWLYYVARTIKLDKAFAVRRGVPGLSFAVQNHRSLQRVIVSTRDAQELATRLTGS